MNIIKQLKDSNGNNIYPIGYAQGGMKMDLLWTNPSPTANFAAQTVSLDLSEYDLFMLVSRDTTGGDTCNMVFALPNTTVRMFFITDSGTTNRNTGYRRATISGTGVQFLEGYQGNSTSNNALCIPYQIYGIKMSYVVPTSVHGLQYVEV